MEPPVLQLLGCCDAVLLVCEAATFHRKIRFLLRV